MEKEKGVSQKLTSLPVRRTCLREATTAKVGNLLIDNGF